MKLIGTNGLHLRQTEYCGHDFLIENDVTEEADELIPGSPGLLIARGALHVSSKDTRST